MTSSAPLSPRPLPPSARPRLIVGGDNVHTAVSDIADSAEKTLTAAVFRIDSRAPVKSMRRAHDRDVRVQILADDDAAGKHGLQGLRKWSTVSTLGPDPAKQHSKGIVADSTSAMVSTDIADKDGSKRLEFGVRFQGDPARLLDQALSAPSGTLAASEAIRAATSQGILINDHESGMMPLTTTMRQALAHGTADVLVATKSWDDQTSTTLLASNTRAASRILLTHSIPRSQQDELRKAGVTVRVLPTEGKKSGPELHGSLISASDTALIASAYFESRVLDGSNGRLSREMGVLAGGQVAREAAALLDRIAVH